MATRTTTSDFTNATDAQFRAWGKWFRDCFSSAGFTVDSEVFGTGTNWTDVTTPNGANQARVTLIVHLADATQGTTPYYLKVYIGSGSAAGNPGFRFELGTGLSGTNITGSLKDTGATHLTATATTQTMSHYSSGDTGRVMIMMSVSGTSWAAAQMLGFVFQRRKNGSGVDQNTGCLLNWLSGGVSTAQGFLAASVGPTARTGWECALWSGSAAFNGLTPVGPCFYDMGPAEFGIGVIAFVAAEFAVGNTLTVTTLGSAHVFLATQIVATGIGGSGAAIHNGVLYE